MMRIIKTRTRVYEITAIRSFGKYGAFAKERKKVFGGDGRMKELCKCFNCGHEFSDDEDINAAFMKGHKNVFVCNDCAEKLSAEDSE